MDDLTKLIATRDKHIESYKQAEANAASWAQQAQRLHGAVLALNELIAEAQEAKEAADKARGAKPEKPEKAAKKP